MFNLCNRCEKEIKPGAPSPIEIANVIGHSYLSEHTTFIVDAVKLVAQIENMATKKCFCQDSGCLSCISKRILKVFDFKGVESQTKAEGK